MATFEFEGRKKKREKKKVAGESGSSERTRKKLAGSAIANGDSHLVSIVNSHTHTFSILWALYISAAAVFPCDRSALSILIDFRGCGSFCLSFEEAAFSRSQEYRNSKMNNEEKCSHSNYTSNKRSIDIDENSRDHLIDDSSFDEVVNQ